MRAEAALKAGGYEEAIKTASGLLAEDPSQIGALETLARAQWHAGRYEDVLTSLSRLIRMNPYEPGYHALKGSALQCLGRYGESVRSFVRGGDTPGSCEAATDLRAWQAKLVEDLLRDDPVFRAHYTRDPETACASRGFEFGGEASIRDWFLHDDSARASLFTRPS